MTSRPKPSAKNSGEFDKFSNFMQRLVAVPHSEIKAKLDAEKRARVKRRASRVSREKD